MEQYIAYLNNLNRKVLTVIVNKFIIPLLIFSHLVTKNSSNDRSRIKATDKY